MNSQEADTKTETKKGILEKALLVSDQEVQKPNGMCIRKRAEKMK